MNKASLNLRRVSEKTAAAARATRRYAGKLNRRAVLSLAFVVFGLGLLGYAGAEYYAMFSAQDRLARIWEQQNTAPDPAAKMTASDGLTRLVIPKIDLDAIVVEGANMRDLRLGPGRIKSSALPGENGNSVITAHRDTFFRHVYQLGKGDEIIVRRNGERLKYSVTGKKIVDPSDISVLRQTEDPQLTLITCYPTYYIGPAPERLVIFSKLVEKGPDTALSAERAAAASAGSGAH